MKNKRYIATMVGLLLMMGAGTTAYGQIVKGKVFGGGQLAQVNGDTAKVACNVTINSGSVYGQVYGAGEGVKIDDASFTAADRPDVAKVTGNTKVSIGSGRGGGGTAWRDVFGGGALAKVQGNTFVSMTGGNIAANLFGGGEGDIKMNDGKTAYERFDGSLVITSADISGNTNVEITGGNVIWDRTSSTTTTSNTTTTYTYTKTVDAKTGQNATETAATNDQKNAIKESYELQGYTDVTVGDPSGVGPYTYAVTYTIPAYTLVETSKTQRTDLTGAGYIETSSSEEISTVDGEIVWWNPDEDVDDATVVDGKKYYNSKFYDAEKKRFLIEHNIFGGGYIACNVADTAYVTMTRGLGDNRLTKTLQWQRLFEDDNKLPCFYCFGGGYGAYTTVKNTVVNVHVDDYDKTLDATVTNPDEQLAKPRRTATKEIGGTANPLEDNPIYMGIYNNEYGIAHATVLGVLGGSYAGFVKENTDVTVGGETFISRVYGGGFGQLEAYNRLTDSDVIYNDGTHDKTRTNLGEVGGNTYVHVIGANIYGNVYGGGAGVEAATPTGGSFQDFTMGEVMGVTEVNIHKNAHVFGNVYGGGDVANVSNTLLIDTDGDDETPDAKPTVASHLNIYGGKVYGEAFGGGSGRVASKVASHPNNEIAVGKVDGNTLVHIYNGVADQDDVEAGWAEAEGDAMIPYVYGDIYGGCAYGVVTGSTDVLVDGGKIGDNIFGGGFGHISDDSTPVITSANVKGNSIVTINGGFALWNETSTVNGDVKTWPKDNYSARGKDIKDANALFYNSTTKRFVKDHNVYGGGNVACVVGTEGSDKYANNSDVELRFPVLFKAGDYKTGNTVVMMNESHLGDPDLFMNYNEWTEAPDWSLAAKCWQATLDEQREPQFSVFGAGKGLLTETLHNSQARVEVLAVRYNINGQLLFYQDASKSLDNVGTTATSYGAAEHWSVGWDEAYETKLQWNAEENDGGTEKDKLANFYPEDYARPNYVDAERRLRTAAFAKQIGTAGNTVMQIIGGGYNGSVGGNSLASGESRAIIGKMYGGGYGSYEGWKLAQDIDNGTPNYANKVGTVAGQSVLNIDRGCLVRSDVFAGGAGVESLKLDANNDVIPETEPEYKTAEYTDFTEVARVGSTHLKFGLLGASKGYEFVVPVVYGYVYGGGDVANVTGVAKSDFVRGQAMRYFFGGGNGRLKSQCKDYTTLGGVGATDVHFDVVRKENDPKKEPDMYDKYYGSEHISYNIEPIVWHRAFAGGRNGLVRGYDSDGNGSFDDDDDIKPDTRMLIDGGQFGYNIFGGGEGTIDTLIVDGVETYEVTSADILGNTNIIVKGGNQNIDQIWDYVNYSWTKANKDDKGNSYSPQYDYKKTKFNINHNIYGGGRTACEVKGNTNIDMSKGMLNNQYFEKLGTPFLESVEWKEIYNKHASPHFCVFGGGFGKLATVAHDTHVNVNLSAGAANVAPPNNEFNNTATHQHNDANKGYCGNTHIYNDIHNDNAYTKFPDGQSLMDVIGGGYSGEVKGTCYVTIDGNTFIRNIFGGAYYANAGASVVNVKQGNIDNIYGGGMMGDVKNTVTVNVGQEPHAAVGEKNIAELTSEKAATANHEVVILGNVYGANDVAGIVGATESENGEVLPTYKEDGEGNITTETVDGATINLRGGHVYGSVYGGGNGDYLYMLDQNVAEVTAEEQYEIGGEKKLVYRVPIRKQDFPSLNTMSDAQKIVNLATYRPAIMKTKIDFKGNSSTDLLCVDGNIYGGGSSATISNFTGKEADSFVKLNVGSHIRVGGVYLGSDGDALFNTSGANNFIEDFPKLNNITLAKTVDWINDPTNRSIPEKYLPVPNKDRPNVYKNVLDLYFMPVEMNMMPEVTWGNKKVNSSLDLAVHPTNYKTIPEDANASGVETTGYLTDAVIGTFCCGGNRGNMNTTTDFHVNFPEGLTITGNIIGGCNNSNDTKTDANGNVMSHTGGFLLGKHGVGADHTPQIHLTLRNKFLIEKQQGRAVGEPTLYPETNNVFGGCYESGTVRGDILVDVRSNMLMAERDEDGELAGLDPTTLRQSVDEKTGKRTVASIYGAGFGPRTWVYGDTEVRLGEATQCSSSDTNGQAFNTTGASCNYIFGGGREGNVVGNTTVRVLSGRVAGCVVGGSYAGILYGNAQTMVGYPEVYYRCNKSGEYKLTRADMSNAHVGIFNSSKGKYEGGLVDANGNPVVKTSIWHTEGDLVSSATYNQLSDADKANFSAEHSVPVGNDWSKVYVQIDKAIYGGGYALSSGSSVGSGSYTVKKYTKDYRFLPEVITGTYHIDESEKGVSFNNYGGNTFVMIGDVTGDYDVQADTGGEQNVADAQKTRDHISISSSSLEAVSTKTGDDLFGLYYQQGGDAESHAYIRVNYQTTKLAEDEKQYYRFIGEGGVYGDGRLSLSEGFRVSDAMGYGYGGNTPAEPKLMNCIHRFDIARFKDCCITLLGDRDYASVEGADAQSESYAFAHVGEIQMYSSIDRESKYSSKKANRSRNYIGLSNKVTDLGAVWSDDAFETALYHDKTGALGIKHEEVSGITDIEGAVTYKKVKTWFTSDEDDVITDAAGNTVTKVSSGYYDNGKASVKKEDRFQLRNSATACNMIGIASGLALVVQGDYVKNENGVKSVAQYYGPVKGVFEVDLVNVRAGEAGGYVYAQNIHEEKTTRTEEVQAPEGGESHSARRLVGGDPGSEGKVATFLETSGNFVFPSNETRKVIDNCFPSVFTNDLRDGSEAHYWYVSGFKYYYDGTITGYTYDGKSRVFDMKNDSRLIFMPGTKAGAEITLKSFRFLNRHATGKQANCDIENRLLTDEEETAEVKWTDIISNDIINGTEVGNNISRTSYYNLSLSISDKDRYAETTTVESVVKDIPRIAYLKEDRMAKEEGVMVYQDKTDSELTASKLTCTSPVDNPLIAVRLTDITNNNGKIDENTSYYDRYLSDPCVAQIVLTAPALDKSGKPLYDSYTPVTVEIPVNGSAANYTYYIQDDHGDYVAITTQEALDLSGQSIPVYYPQAEDAYLPVGDGDFDSGRNYFTLKSSYVSGNITKDYVAAWTGTRAEFDTNRASLYYLRPKATPQTYEYNLTLTINYIPGPSYKGGITIHNCALPGEAIRLSSETVTITSDENEMPQTGSVWRFGPGKKEYANDTYTWVMDESDKTKVFTYNPKDDAENDDVKASRGVLANAYHDGKQDLYIPAYYFMNGYVAQYSFKVRGIEEEFDVTINPQDTLVIHNYHRMDPTLGSERTHVETYIRKAAERYASDVTRLDADKAHDADAGKGSEPRQVNQKLSYVNRPRVYIEDVEDLKAFAKYVNAAENDYGNDLEFFLMTDLTVPDDWTAITNFNGIFHGNGHIINGLGTKSLFAANAGNIYNLGLLQGNITATETPTLYHCCYTKSNNTVYRMDGSAVTSYTEDDWKYGKVAYDLNQYYLEERYDLREGADTHNHDGYVENIFANGDYQYARTYAQDAREEYLRTNANPHYVISDFDAIVTNPEEITYHKTTHDVDESRAYYTGDEPAVFDEYYPLFETNKQNTTASVTTGKKNDYLFFGQTLNTDTNLPATIASHLVSDMTNRVYRAFGYYQSKTDDLFHFNRAAYALQPTLTAIDFSGEHNDKYDWMQGMKDAADPTVEVPSGNAAIFYPQVMDMPESFVSFKRAEGVTRNILVYTPNDKEVGTASYVVNSALGYNESTEESKIEGHQVVLADDEWTAPLLHLVDKQDFNAPIAFEATKAWYERKPVDETGYVETPGQSWESICLPYTVQKATLSYGLQMYDAATGNKIPGLKTDITFFYGADNSSIDPNHGDEIVAQTPTNNNNIGHEYWLRYLNVYDASGSEATATFTRPSKNEFPAYVPAIVSFPGSRFYEFDMSYKNTDIRQNQTITFSAEDAGVTVTDDAVKSVSEGEATYTGAFLNSDNSNPDNVRCAIELGSVGNSFEKNMPIYPFRGYITTAVSSSAKSRSVIYIANDNDAQEEPKTELKPEIPGHESESDEADDYLIIKVKGHTVLVTSSAEHKLPLVGVNGINYGIWNIPEGTSEFTIIAPGVYLLNGQKFVIR